MRRLMVLAVSCVVLPAVLVVPVSAAEQGEYKIASFSADVTPPLGHPLLAGLCPPGKSVADPLFAKGFVFMGAGKPVVQVSVDWCEIRNAAHQRWRDVLAEAAGTAPERVMLSSVHQHDAPLADLDAQKILDERKLESQIIDPEFHERVVQRVAKALREGLKVAQPVTHIGLGKAKAKQLASNRRTIGPDGRPHYGRMSAARDQALRDRPEETIDPWVKTLSFWNGKTPLVAMSSYATHPMSYYRTGNISADFPGLARAKRQAALPDVLQIYCSGCSGNVTVGKYNDGNHANRPVLAQRLFVAMTKAWENTKRHPITQAEFRSTPLRLEPRKSKGFTLEDFDRKLQKGRTIRDQSLAAMGLAWRRRADAGAKLDVPVLDFGIAQFLLLPGESYVEYQLLAQKVRPESFVIVSGYGQCAPGYIPIERSWKENDSNLGGWCWIQPGSEKAMTEAIKTALQVKN